MQHPADVQLIANLVVRRPNGRVLLIRYHDDERWWLPGEDLEAYEHPDDAAARILAGTFPRLITTRTAFAHIESFRGRRGWHVMFDYLVEGEGDGTSSAPTEWFDATDSRARCTDRGSAAWWRACWPSASSPPGHAPRHLGWGRRPGSI